MIAVDTNLLVYAHRRDSEWHEPALEALSGLAEGSAPWAVPAPCFHEFLAIVTHPKIYRPPTPLALALEQLTAWRESPTLVVLSESEGYWERLGEVVLAGKAVGGQVHDARVAGLCLHYRVSELWSADRDFTRFRALKVRNPLVG